jgi:hypothetical protein
MSKIEIAENPNTSPEVLQSLATDETSGVRWRVAYNPNTSSETLQSLATDENYGIRYHVGRHSNATELIRRLVLMTDSKLAQ